MVLGLLADLYDQHVFAGYLAAHQEKVWVIKDIPAFLGCWPAYRGSAHLADLVLICVWMARVILWPRWRTTYDLACACDEEGS